MYTKMQGSNNSLCSNRSTFQMINLDPWDHPGSSHPTVPIFLYSLVQFPSRSNLSSKINLLFNDFREIDILKNDFKFFLDYDF